MVVSVLCLFLTVSWVVLLCMIMALPGQTHLLFENHRFVFVVFFFVLFDSLRPLNNLSVMRDGSSWV